MICAGLGGRSDVVPDTVLAAIDRALGAHGLTRAVLSALSTVPRKEGEPAFREVALRLGLRLIVPDEDALRDAAPRCLTTSSASLRATGVGSASEAAALAACGPAGRLLGPRHVHNGVACAIAITGNQP